MTRDEFLVKMLEKGKVTQGQIDKIKAKADVVATYKKDGSKMTKEQIKTVLDAVLDKG